MANPARPACASHIEEAAKLETTKSAKSLREGLGKTAPAGISALLGAGFLAACQPTVQLEAPEKPITVNLNIKLDADVRVRLEERARDDIEQNDDIF